MIEIVTNKERNLRNVTQIGTPREDNKIYIENLAYTRLKDDIYAAKSVFVLMGHTECMENRYITFVEAVIPVNTIDFSGNLPKWNDYVWKDVFREIKRLYEDMIIVGWALDIKGMSPKITPELERIHREHFGGIHQLLFLMDTLEGEETVYVQKGSSLTPKDGFYIYYCTRTKSENIQKQEIAQNYEDTTTQNIETIPISRKKPNYEQRKNVDRLIGLERTQTSQDQNAEKEDRILQMQAYDNKIYENQRNKNKTYQNKNFINTSDNDEIMQQKQTYADKIYEEEIQKTKAYAKTSHNEKRQAYINPTDDENEKRTDYERNSHTRKEEPSVELDVNFSEWTSSRGGKYRQMLKENEKKKNKNNSSGTNIGIAIAAAMLVFVIGVGIYENGDALLEQADKAAEAMSGNIQKTETQATQTEVETQAQTSTQTSKIPVEIISGENE